MTPTNPTPSEIEQAALRALDYWRRNLTGMSLWVTAWQVGCGAGFGRKRVLRVQRRALELEKETR